MATSMEASPSVAAPLYVTVSSQTASMTVLDTSVSLNAGNTTNNTTNNVTNNNVTNITNNTTTNNTTNINSNNTSTVIDNSTKNIFKNSILNYDASVTNDSSVKKTLIGTFNIF
ncbi:MAG: hypothetical protein O3B29_04610 [Proteobacteria bacterium]|nr:hypothetical protein [Pseudomonadota bacterium]